jgi:hypothetical protein
MRFTTILAAVIAPLAVLAAPVEVHSRSDIIVERQARPTKPTPCVRVTNTTEEQTKVRSEAFAKAFIYDKDISEAFKYIAKDYIVRPHSLLIAFRLHVQEAVANSNVTEPQSPGTERIRFSVEHFESYLGFAEHHTSTHHVQEPTKLAQLSC